MYFSSPEPFLGPQSFAYETRKRFPMFSMLLGLPREGVENPTIELEAVET